MSSQPDGSIAAAISNAVVQTLHEYTGRGPTKARTTIGRDAIMVVLADTLTKGEQKLAANGHRDNVLATRHTTQVIMRDDIVAEIERITDRKVIAFMSANHINPDMASEVFVLEPVD
jgi:uncharacterized protein YbcI